MALLAESLVDEWLNRAGFFTVRGVKHGVGEIDLLGVRPSSSGLEAWHVEVQASFRPISYIAPLPAESVAGFAKSRTSMKARPQALVEAAAQAWVRKKFTSQAKRSAREAAWPGLKWRFVLVHAAVKWPDEIEAIRRAGIKIVPLHRVLSDLGKAGTSGIRGSAGTDLSEVIVYFYEHTTAQTGRQI
jgi:hypothetical protein